MRKQELLHLHQLMFVVRGALETEGAVPDGAFTTYEDLGVWPTACNRTKREHELAIGHLLDGILSVVESQDADEPTGSPLVH
jgi:hypothetical protein